MDDTAYDRERPLFLKDLFAWVEQTGYEEALNAAGAEAKFLVVLTLGT
ncbi:hypothetical protein [Nocardia barduliensis]|nr:hypothetical protein [Nocardia barduliensis]